VYKMTALRGTTGDWGKEPLKR